MPKIIDITGKTFTDLTVTRFAKTIKGRAYWYCNCICGNKNHLVSGKNLRLGVVKRCNNPIHLKGHNKGESHGLWKGQNVSYKGLHQWVRRWLLKPEYCIDCKIAKPYDVANISQEYKRNLSDWEWLCRKCHMIKDGRYERYSLHHLIR